MLKKFEISAFILRITLGIIFFLHGLEKWIIGIEQFSVYVDLPLLIGTAVTTIEIIGGVALLIGVKIRLAAFLLSVVMIGAIFQIKLTEGFIGGFDYNVALLSMLLALFITGSRLLSYDIPKRDKYI